MILENVRYSSRVSAHGLKFAHLNTRILNSVTLNTIGQVLVILEDKIVNVQINLKPGKI